MNIDEIISFLKESANLKSLEGMARVGITPDKAFGVRIPVLRKLAKEIGRNHQLAVELWSRNTRETRILACMIADYRIMPESQLDSWVSEFDYWEICDQCIMNLAEKIPFAYQKAIEWARRNEEYVKRAGYVLMARLAVSDKKAQDHQFLNFFPTIENGLEDDRHQVKLAISWALRQIGKRNIQLNKLVIQEIEKYQKEKNKTREWICKDVFKDITRETILEKLKAKSI